MKTTRMERRAVKAVSSSCTHCIDRQNYDRRDMTETADKDIRYKVAVYVPEADVDKVKQAGKKAKELDQHD
jgi:hypothetical protein